MFVSRIVWRSIGHLVLSGMLGVRVRLRVRKLGLCTSLLVLSMQPKLSIKTRIS